MFYQLIAKPMEWFYGFWPNYAGAIGLLTLLIMIVLLPLTLKGTRSMLAMQKLQPEMKKLQAKHRDDRQKLNEEKM
jgi:YidC/Oxa1 family membrane protein insertase